jgi:hypothetical protein
MEQNLGPVMDKKDFLSDGVFDKEPYEGLLISARSDGKLDIGIQLTQDKVLKVDEAYGEEVREKIAKWTPHIPTIQKQWGENPDLQNYDG